jgi:ABC-type cobalt transport system substrate-binding protein
MRKIVLSIIGILLFVVELYGVNFSLQTFGGAEDDWANAVVQTQDGGYLIVGKTESFGAGEADVYVLKLDKNGKKQWEKTFGGAKDDWANAVIQTQDGGYLIVGRTS